MPQTTTTRATRPRSLTLAALLLVLGAAAAPAAVLHDPWLARFEVGEFRDADRIVLAAGAPAGLLDPLTVDPGWRRGADRFFAGEHLPRDPGLVAWRLAVPVLGEAAAAEALVAAARAQWHELSVPEGAAVGVATPVRDGPWTREVRLLRVCRLWRAGRHGEAAVAARQVVADRRALGLSASEALVWELRAWHLAVRAGQQPDDGLVWDRLADLGLYDLRSGWSVWRVLREARGLALLPDGAATRATALMIATAGELGMDAAGLRAAGFAPEVEAGLGALLLPRADLAAHLARFPDPPADGTLQGYWLRGHRRLDASTGRLEELATTPGLRDGWRLDLWRRASERHLIGGDWSAGLTALERALSWDGDAVGRGTRSRLREWLVQALALAVHRGRTAEAARIAELAGAHGTAADRREFAVEARTLLARLGETELAASATATTPADPGPRERAEALIRAGAAPDVGSLPALALPAPDRWRDLQWQRWARWGLVLEATRPQTARDADLVAGLQAVLDATDAAQRHATACAVLARSLRGDRAVAPLLHDAIRRDIERLAGGAARPAPSVLPDLRDPAPWDAASEQRRGLALLGAALALGDDTGVIHAAVRMPAAGLDDAAFWSFWYPVPADPALRRVLAGGEVPAELLLAIARNESLFEPAVRSRAGALGYMQIMPFHYDDPAGSPGDGHWSHPATSVRAGARILAGEVARYDGDPYRAVAAYNAGRGAVDRWDRQLGGQPDRAVFWAWIGYPETRGYTLRVLRDREVYRELLGAGP